MINQIQWLGYGSFVIQGTPLIYINPWRVTRTSAPADLILISDDHYAHCSPVDIAKLRGPNTLIVGNEAAAREIPDCAVLRPWQSVTVERACVKAVPAYVTPDTQSTPVRCGLGFLVSMNFYDIYYAGDTQIIPQMSSIKPDIVILPIDGNGTLTVREAAEVTRQLQPRWVIPYNWGTGVGASRIEAHIFAEEVGSDSQVRILQPA